MSHAQRTLPTGPSYEYSGAITRVIDGDTVVMDIDLGFKIWLRDESVRLEGINAPERNEQQGPPATDHLVQLLANLDVPNRVTFISTWQPWKQQSQPIHRGKYGRIVGRLIGLIDGRAFDLNRAMVDDGFAVEATY